MVDILTQLQANLVIKQINYEGDAKAKIEELTRIRLGIAPGFAASKSQLETTANAMKSAGLGGMEGGMGMGATANALIGSISGLAETIKLAYSNSKILTTVMSTIAKAVGLLVDVVLMPFLPIITLGILWLFKAIMDFKKMWDTIFTKDVVKTLTGALVTIGGLLQKGIGFLLDVTIMPLLGAAKTILDAIVWLIDNAGKIPIMFLETVGAVLQWIYDTFFKNPLAVLKWSIDFALGELKDFIMWLWGAAVALTTLQFEITKGAIDGIIGWLYSVKDGFDLAVNLVASGMSSLPTDTDVIAGIKSAIGWKAQGGYIAQSGTYHLHKGETVTPAHGGGAINVQITGSFKSDEEMYQRFVDRLRREQWRTNI